MYIHTYILHTYVHTYRTVSNEALCVITGLIPIHIKIEETVKYYEILKGHGNQLDQEMEIKHLDTPSTCS